MDEKVFELMEKMYLEMQSMKDAMNVGFNDVNNRLDKVEQTVIRIENDHGQKLTVLMDGYKQNSDKLDPIEKEVNKHEEIILRRVK